MKGIVIFVVIVLMHVDIQAQHAMYVRVPLFYLIGKSV